MELYHFDNEGWCILASIEGDMGEEIFKFYTLRFFAGHPRAFSVNSLASDHLKPTGCELRYSEKSDFDGFKKGDEVFYFKNSKVSYGTINAVDRGSKEAVFDNGRRAQIFTLLAYNKNDAVNVCAHCSDKANAA